MARSEVTPNDAMDSSSAAVSNVAIAFLSQLEGERMGRRLEETEKACLEAARLAEKEVRKALFTYGMLNIRVGCC